ncbi:hypothetical protein CRG98_014107 [Punica granatum]|uniref:Uncharacterized protein n=1 Tax=Punica granatum TaxID=22663 RepID=A0A2I0KAD5_PUNGR|nr:hypothetical protein CRG98_014107 [Punica granatum]
MTHDARRSPSTSHRSLLRWVLEIAAAGVTIVAGLVRNTSNRAAIVFYRERGRPSAIPRLACPLAAPFGRPRGWPRPPEALKTLIRPLISFN